MLGIIVVTHSTLCNGLIESGEFISGKLNNVRAVSLGSEGVEIFRNKLELAVEDLEKECESILFMADIKCATPYNEASRYVQGNRSNNRLISGVNLPMFLEAALSLNYENNIDKIISSVIDSGKNSIDIFRVSLYENDDDDEL